MRQCPFNIMGVDEIIVFPFLVLWLSSQSRFTICGLGLWLDIQGLEDLGVLIKTSSIEL